METGEAPDVQALCQAAHQAGRQEASDELNAQLAELEAVTKQLNEVIDAVAATRRQALEQAASDVGELILILSRQIASESLALHPEALPALIESAVSELPSTEDLHIHVAPSMVEPISRHVPESLRSRLLADPNVEHGCIVRTRFASLDATVETAEQGIREAIDRWLTEQTWAADWMMRSK